MTVEELARRLDHLPISAVMEKHGSKSLEQVMRMHANGTIVEEEWQAYCYLWRNCAARFSDVMASYQLE